MPPPSSLIVSTSDRPAALHLVFEGISLQSQFPAELIVADDGSGPATAALIRSWRLRLPCSVQHLWQPPDGFRKTIILNRAVRAARGDYLLFLDGDCVPHRRFISDHLRHAQPGTFVQGRRAGIRQAFVAHFTPRRFHPLLWFARRRLYGLRYGLRRPRAQIRLQDRSLIQGCNLALWREDFVRVNGYDEAFVGWGHEDTELAERLGNAGVVCKTVIGQAIVYHLDHPRVPRHRADFNAEILARTKREKRTRCARGLTAASLPTAAPAG